MEYTIYVKPHLKKFLPRYLNTAEPIKMDSTNVHGKVFVAVGAAHPDAVIKYNQHEYPCELIFCLNDDMKRLRPKKKEMMKINIYFDKLFKEIMFQWVVATIRNGGYAVEGIKNFLEYYHISEDDYSWNNAHRAWMRYIRKDYEKRCAEVS